MEGKWSVRAHQTQEMKGKEGSGDPEGREAKSGVASSGREVDTSGEKGFFADQGRSVDGLTSTPRQQPSWEKRGGCVKVTMISPGVEISIAGGGGEMVVVLSLGRFFSFFFFFFSFFNSYILC